MGAAVDGWTARVWDLVVRPLVGQVGLLLQQYQVLHLIFSGYFSSSIIYTMHRDLLPISILWIVRTVKYGRILHQINIR